MKNYRWISICIGIVLLASMLACNFSSLASNTGSDATAQALATSIAGNATLAAEIASTPQVEQVQPTATEAAPRTRCHTGRTGDRLDSRAWPHPNRPRGNPGRAVPVWN